MPTQTSASRGYVLFRGAIRDTHKSPTNCLPGCGHDPRSAPNLERHRSSWMQTFDRKKCSHFSPTNVHLHFHMKSPSVFLIILLIKARYAYCGSSFLHTVSVLQKMRDAYTSVKSFWENGMYRRFLSLLLSMSLLIFSPVRVRAQDVPAESELYAKSAVLMDADSGRILYEKNGHEAMATAQSL